MADGGELTRAWVEGRPGMELLDVALDAIGRHNGTVGGVLTVMEESARAEAAACDRAARDGRRLGPLHGMPVTLKDNIDTAGTRTTVASDFFRDRVPEADATVVPRLRAAGAVIVGKANLHEFVCGATGQSHHLGPCRNPWNPEHVPGGSSSGSGATVAANMCIASIGSDTGGSIRNPAAFNGVCGLKPTNGSVPNRGSFPVSPPHDTLGPLARRIEDVAAVYAAIAGHDPADPTSMPHALADTMAGLERGVDGLVIGLPRAFYYDDVQDEVATGVAAGLGVLTAAGARSREVTLDGAAEAWRLLSTVLVMTDAAELHRERMASEPDRMGADVFQRISVGLKVSGMEYAAAMRFREGWRHRIAEIFADVDLMLVPTTPFTAPRIAEVNDMGGTSNQINRFNFGWSMGGVPTLSLPCGIAGNGLPFGLQLVAPWWREDVLMAAGRAFQARTDWHLRTAPLLG